MHDGGPAGSTQKVPTAGSSPPGGQTVTVYHPDDKKVMREVKVMLVSPQDPGWRGAIKRGQGAAEIAGELNVTIVFFGVAIAKTGARNCY